MDLIASEFAGQPIWLWLSFLSVIGLLLWLDLGLIMFALYLCGCAVGALLRGWVVSRSAPPA